MIANKSYVATSSKLVAHIEGELKGDMYEGSSHTEFLLYEIHADEEYYLVYQNEWFI